MNNTSEPLFARRPSSTCAFADCVERSSFPDMPICREHAGQAWKAFELAESDAYKAHIMADAKDLAAAQKAANAASTRAKIDAKRRPGTIYYLRVGDRIKIGFTIDLYQRMMQYPPNSVLMATHPGTPATERDMHSRFSQHLADGREWFHPHADIATHIAQVQQRYPLTTSIEKMRAPTVPPQATLRPKTNMTRKV